MSELPLSSLRRGDGSIPEEATPKVAGCTVEGRVVTALRLLRPQERRTVPTRTRSPEGMVVGGY
jgi:hypothetical protein